MLVLILCQVCINPFDPPSSPGRVCCSLPKAAPGRQSPSSSLPRT